ncbi:MAG: N-acetylneuraminate synthase family protein [Parcubacteria group bacterium]|nr:N-acetylneuraminate synthase family protein [Parcubacteria group bacterium]
MRMKIGDRLIGDDCPCFIVAEAGANHDGDFTKAGQLIKAVADIGADAIKFQHYTAEKLVSKEAKRYWLVRGDEGGHQFDPSRYKESQIETFAKIDGIPREKDIELMRLANERNIVLFSTPFDFESVDHLDALGIPMFKIASGDLTYRQFVEYIARKGKPVILSTGAANLAEIKEAAQVVRKTGNGQLILLHCTLAYPTPLEHANLLMMRHLQLEFPEALVGLSDHTPGIIASVVGAMLGAAMIEKHFTNTPGPAVGEDKVGESPDHDIGLGVGKFAEMIFRVRDDEANGLSVRLGIPFAAAASCVRNGEHFRLLGKGEKTVDSAVEMKARLQARRSVVAALPLKRGAVLTEETIKTHLTVKRPGTGIPPYEIGLLSGRIVKNDIPADAVLQWDDVL